MDHLIGALAFQAAGANPNDVAYIPYDAGGKALAGLLSGETQIISTGLGELDGCKRPSKNYWYYCSFKSF